MLKNEKLSYYDVLEDLNLPEDSLPILENVLGGNYGPNSVVLENSPEEDLNSEQILQKLKEAGLSSREINILASLFENINIPKILDEVGGATNLLRLSPNYRLKQTLTLAKNEIKNLRKRLQISEKTSGEVTKLKKAILQSESELKAKQKIIDNLNEQLSDTEILNEELESQLNTKSRGKDFSSEKEFELIEIKRKNNELTEELEIMEQRAIEAAEETEDLYKERIASLQNEVYSAIDKKQKEWEEYYAQLNEERKKEILTLHERKEEEISKYKKIVKEQEEELEKLMAYKNPLSGLFKQALEKLKTTQ